MEERERVMVFFDSLPQRSSDCVSLLMAACSVVKHLADSSVQGTLSDDYSVGIYMDTVICYLGNTQELCSILIRDSRLQKSC